jgi:hypothetical protein
MAADAVVGDLQPFTVARDRAPLTLTPVIATSSEEDTELREAAISLFHHALPAIGRTFMRTLLASERIRTLLLLRSAEGAPAARSSALLCALRPSYRVRARPR